jgi:hypothetical protein
MNFPVSSRRNRVASILTYLCLAVLLVGLSACSKNDLRQTMREARRSLDKLMAGSKEPEQTSQSAEPQPEAPAKTAKLAHHVKAAEPVDDADNQPPEPTQEELAEFLRGKLLSLSPSDGFNDNLEVRFDSSTSTLTVVQPTGRCEQFLGALNVNNITWDIFDPSDERNPREKLLRLTSNSVSGKQARACFDLNGRLEEGTSTNRVRLLFSLYKSEQIPRFQDKMATALKKLIILSGGAEGKELFPDSEAKPHSKKK